MSRDRKTGAEEGEQRAEVVMRQKERQRERRMGRGGERKRV